MTDEIEVVAGGPGDAPTLLALFDDAVAWLVARDQTAQWGSEPWSERPSSSARADEWAAGGGLRFARDPGAAPDALPAGAMVVGEHMPYVPPPERPELYVMVLLVNAAYRRRGVGAALIATAEAEARAAGAEQLRVDCWAGVPGLPAQYERLGFTRTGSFEVKGWPGAILERRLS
ncbi:acetyltransferase [Baekduia alba]|uniref:GNAT family N-acetyltransferase n=1 Tax=Baekduia alba TaxID=2997333 RepID=UPI002341EF29|nr:GNAT family N-acetyltransferase [Baekduia alba]WCB92513.1 acetyltransferase [Baekduia alba]